MQVEINCIASSFGCMGNLASALHQFLLTRHPESCKMTAPALAAAARQAELDENSKLGLTFGCAPNGNRIGLPRAIAAAHTEYLPCTLSTRADVRALGSCVFVSLGLSGIYAPRGKNMRRGPHLSIIVAGTSDAAALWARLQSSYSWFKKARPTWSTSGFWSTSCWKAMASRRYVLSIIRSYCSD